MVEAKKSSHERTEGKRLKSATDAGVYEDDQQHIGGEWSFKKRPDFLKRRNDYWDSLLAVQDKKYTELPREPIVVTLPDGNTKEGTSFVTTPVGVAAMISKQLAGKVIVARVRYPKGRVGTLDLNLKNPEAENEAKNDGWMLWDATRPLEGSCDLELITFNDAIGKDTFWHSSAHVLGETLELEFGVHLCFGPATTDGFFYDTYTGKDVSHTIKDSNK